MLGRPAGRRAHLHLRPAPKQIPPVAPARRPLSTAHKPNRHRPQSALGILPGTGGDRRRLQTPEGRSGPASNLPSQRKPNRSAHLRSLYGLLPVGDAARPFAQSGQRADEPSGAGKICGHPDGGRALSDHRRTRTGISALHPTGERPEDPAGTIGLGIAGASPAADYGPRKDGGAGAADELNQRFLVQTFWEAGLTQLSQLAVKSMNFSRRRPEFLRDSKGFARNFRLVQTYPLPTQRAALVKCPPSKWASPFSTRTTVSKTARITVTGAWSKTSPARTANGCSGRFSTWAKSTTAKRPPGSRAPKSSMPIARPSLNWRCFRCSARSPHTSPTRCRFA